MESVQLLAAGILGLGGNLAGHGKTVRRQGRLQSLVSPLIARVGRGELQTPGLHDSGNGYKYHSI